MYLVEKHSVSCLLELQARPFFDRTADEFRAYRTHHTVILWRITVLALIRFLVSSRPYRVGLFQFRILSHVIYAHTLLYEMPAKIIATFDASRAGRSNAIRVAADVNEQLTDLSEFEIAALVDVAYHQPLTQDDLKDISWDLIGRVRLWEHLTAPGQWFQDRPYSAQARGIHTGA